MTKKLSMQQIILTLQQYWSAQGCMLMQAYDTEKGAGTMSPYTFLRAIGPEPWHAAMWNRHDVLLMVVTLKTLTDSINTINFRS